MSASPLWKFSLIRNSMIYSDKTKKKEKQKQTNKHTLKKQTPTKKPKQTKPQAKQTKNPNQENSPKLKLPTTSLEFDVKSFD